MKVTIAAQAALMLLGMDHDYFDRVPTILVYPSGFSVPTDRWQQGGGFAASGQAVYRGPVILAWDEVLAEAFTDRYGNKRPELVRRFEAIPMLGTGKVDLRSLRELAAERLRR